MLLRCGRSNAPVKGFNSALPLFATERYEPGPTREGIGVQPVHRPSGFARNVFALHRKHLVHHMRTKFALVIQWDGYMLQPNARTSDFVAFGVHGIFNLPEAEPDDVIARLVPLLTDSVMRSEMGDDLLFNCRLNEQSRSCRSARATTRRIPAGYAPTAATHALIGTRQFCA